MKIRSRVKRCAQAGFTLMEILAVITLIAFLMVLVVPNIVKVLSQGRIKNTEQGLQALNEKPSNAPEGWNGPYTQNSRTKFNDSWNRPLKYKCPGDHNPDSYDLYSLGADGVEGGSGPNADIGNW